MIKPTIPSGTRDFSPEEVYKRQFIFNTIRSVFEKYGYQPIETPTMENTDTLKGKYGEEGDRLIFDILDSGDFMEGWGAQGFPTSGIIRQNAVSKSLRYDLTVPFARYVVMHQNEITFPFKRYQIQPVYRADRPQRGRYREFFQCDADVVGSDSLLNEVELIQIYIEVFEKLKIPVKIHLNNRKILVGLSEFFGVPDRFVELVTVLDKKDKIGIEGVTRNLSEKGFKQDVIDKVIVLNEIAEENISGEIKLTKIRGLISSDSIGQKGIEELDSVMKTLFKLYAAGDKPEVDINLTLARGLDYYTGIIIEAIPITVKMGSVGGGGRYDDLTGVFGLKGVSGVGISFGADRIYDVMEELKLFPASAARGTQVLFCYFDDASMNYSLPLVRNVRNEGIAAEIYPSAEKMKKQLKYANDKKIPFVVVVGDNEMQSGKLAFKDMESGEQTSLTIDEIIQRLK